MRRREAEVVAALTFGRGHHVDQAGHTGIGREGRFDGEAAR